jgi:protein-tyrosine phosphatase
VIDLHCHLLPGVDDGPDSLVESIEMCRLAAEDGCRLLFATPHLNHPRWPGQEVERLRRLTAELAAAVEGTIEVRLGAEVRLDEALAEHPEELLASGGAIGLGDSHCLLLEAPHVGAAPELESAVHELRVAGWQPILAHPELVEGIAGHPGRAAELVDAGAWLQVTATAVTGELGRAVRRLVDDWIDQGLVHFVASDAHGTRWRPPGLAAARRRLAERWGAELAHLLTGGHAERMLAGEALAPAATAEEAR